MMTKHELIQLDAHSSALHEVGHAIVAEHFGLDTNVVIFLRDTQHSDVTIRYVGGYTEIIGLGRSCFRNACIGFAGYAAAPIAESDDDPWRIFENFFEEEHSETDMAFIHDHKQQWRACKTACHILMKRKSELIQRAAKLETDFLAVLTPEQRNGSTLACTLSVCSGSGWTSEVSVRLISAAS